MWMYTPVARLGRNSLGPMARCKVVSDAEMSPVLFDGYSQGMSLE